MNSLYALITGAEKTLTMKGKLNNSFDGLISNAVHIDIQNVHEFVRSNPDPEIFEKGPKGMVPFHRCWFEFEHNGYVFAVHSIAGSELDGEDIVRPTVSKKGHKTELSVSVFLGYVGKKNGTTKTFASCFRRMYSALYFGQYGDSIRWKDITSEQVPFGPEDLRLVGQEHADYVMSVVVAACQFMQCKNVQLRDVQPDLPRPERRRRERKGIPTYSYKVIQVDPNRTTTVGNERQDPIQTGLTPLHIVRGNFATYTEERPLFGRYVGTFWRPAHVRGNADNGVREHGYDVLSPDRKG